ncbi:MAG TPA: type VI secretion system ATPase TssH, partial [bacterium]|nr:type VI secretion system ATPase TssH [bacterium]
SIKEVSRIVEIQLTDLRHRLGERKIGLVLSPEALQKLADQGFDPLYGARPLKRVIQSELADPLAMKIILGEIKEGDTVKVGMAHGALEIS